MHSNIKKAVVIGAGVGGLSIAIRLAVKGYEVDLFEKNAHPGGKISSFQQEGFSFDAGPSLFTQPGNMEELFSLAGEDISQYFQYKELDIACRYFFENGKIVDAFTDTELFANELNEKLGEDGNAVIHYLESSGKIYDRIGTVFLDHSLHKRRTWLNKRIFPAIRTVRPPHLFRTLHQFNSKKFKTAEAVQIFDRFATYNGSDPYKAPGMLSLIPHLEQNLGTYFPQGGMISIANALYELAKKKGVRFHFNAPVQRIIQHEGKVAGVVVNDKNFRSGIVVSNIDIYFTYKNLLNDIHRSEKVLKQERSSSAIIFYWGIKKEFSQLQLHNIFFSSNYKAEFDHLFKKEQLYKDPTIYVNVTSKIEQVNAPYGKENWFVMVNAPANNGQDWHATKEQCRQQVLGKLSRILDEDIEPLIETRQYTDPVLIEEQTSSYMGSLYGTSSNTRLAAFLRHPNFSDTIKGLYFVGGSVHPGGGIPLCMKSAKIVDGLIPDSEA